MLFLITLVSSFLFLFFSSSWFFVCFFLFSSYLLLTVFPFFQNSFSLFYSFYSDEVSLFMIFMLLIVIYFSYFFSSSSNMTFSISLLFLILLACILTFSSCSLFFLYLGYELSLIPIIFIIILWGSYPERSLSSMMLLVYTSIFTIPFLYVLWYVYFYYGTFSFYNFDFYSVFYSPLSFFFIFILALVFMVKLPIYGLHFWLPMAHVEAPTHGSIVLAGVLLKLGGVALIRCFSITNWFFLSSFTLSYFLVCLIYVPFVCSFQSDFKRLVAYSSVSHIIVVPIILCFYSLIGLKGLILVLLFHGLRSPLLFSIVGFVYNLYSTRQLVSLRSLHLINPLFSFVLVIAFFFTLCVPPFPSFVSEVFFFITSFPLWVYMPVVLVIFSFISLIYNLSWFSNITFSSFSLSVSNESSYYSYISFFPIFMLIFISFIFILLFSSFCWCFSFW